MKLCFFTNKWIENKVKTKRGMVCVYGISSVLNEQKSKNYNKDITRRGLEWLILTSQKDISKKGKEMGEDW